MISCALKAPNAKLGALKGVTNLFIGTKAMGPRRGYEPRAVLSEPGKLQKRVIDGAC